MSKKDKTTRNIAILAGLGIAGYFLSSNIKDAISNLGGGFQMPDIKFPSGIGGFAGLPDAFGAFRDAIPSFETPSFDFDFDPRDYIPELPQFEDIVPDIKFPELPSALTNFFELPNKVAEVINRELKISGQAAQPLGVGAAAIAGAILGPWGSAAAAATTAILQQTAFRKGLGQARAGLTLDQIEPLTRLAAAPFAFITSLFPFLGGRTDINRIILGGGQPVTIPSFRPSLPFVSTGISTSFERPEILRRSRGRGRRNLGTPNILTGGFTPLQNFSPQIFSPARPIASAIGGGVIYG